MAEDEKKQSWITKKDKKEEFAKKLLETIHKISPLALPKMIIVKIKGLTEKKAVDKGLPWMKNLQDMLGKIPESITATQRRALKTEKSTKKLEKAKGGIVQVQKFSRGGTVERPRGVGIAKRGFGQVMR